MKKTVLRCGVPLLLFASCQSQPAQPITKVPSSSDGFAVVELFTSQGCSSCPPADALLGKELAAAKRGKKLIALSFHVDYWNRLGWTDPLSKHEFSQRQYGYAAKTKDNGVYTPQVIVNGQREMVGSNQQSVESAIKEAVTQKPTPILILSSVEVGDSTLKAAYQYTGPVAELHVAVIEKQVTTLIKGGENNGRTLLNYNVVRSWKTITAEDGNHSVQIETPAGYKASEFAVVLFAQGKDYGKVLAADMK